MDVNDPTSLTADVPNYAAQLAGLHGARGVRIGIDRQFNFSESDEEVVNLIEAAVSALQEIGGIVNAVKFPDPVALRGLSSSVSKVETALSHETTFPARAAEYGPALRELLFQAAAVDPLDMGRVLIAREEFKGALNHLFAGIDLLLVPVFAKQIPQWRVMADNPTVTVPWVFKFTAIFNHAGVPSITLPCGFTELGLPVAFQLIGPHLSEALLLRVGHAYQQATDWHMRRPPVVRDADQPAPAR
jgi:amidase